MDPIPKELATTIATKTIKHFNNLPKTGKPQQNEWTVLASITVQNKDDLTLVSLATGSKCIGATKLCPKGSILNDSHAEVLCRRAFLKYLYQQIDLTLNSDLNSIFYIDPKISTKCLLKEDISFHFFSSQIFCGDAAIIPKFCEEIGDPLPEEKDIHRTGAKCLKTENKQDVHDVGEKYHQVGVIRTKPGRGDPTLSVSCSDKVSKWIRLGMQGALLTLLIEKPIYLRSVIFPKNIPFDMDVINRALVGRFDNSNELIDPYVLSVPSIQQVDVVFLLKEENSQPCPSSIIWSECSDRKLEIAVNGRRAGVTKKALNTEKAQLSVCKCQLAKRFYEIVQKHKFPIHIPENWTYAELKNYCKNYNETWNFIKTNVFKNWTEKPMDLLNFTLKEK